MDAVARLALAAAECGRLPPEAEPLLLRLIDVCRIQLLAGQTTVVAEPAAMAGSASAAAAEDGGADHDGRQPAPTPGPAKGWPGLAVAFPATAASPSAAQLAVSATASCDDSAGDGQQPAAWQGPLVLLLQALMALDDGLPAGPAAKSRTSSGRGTELETVETVVRASMALLDTQWQLQSSDQPPAVSSMDLARAATLPLLIRNAPTAHAAFLRTVRSTLEAACAQLPGPNSAASIDNVGGGGANDPSSGGACGGGNVSHGSGGASGSDIGGHGAADGSTGGGCDGFGAATGSCAVPSLPAVAAVARVSYTVQVARCASSGQSCARFGRRVLRRCEIGTLQSAAASSR